MSANAIWDTLKDKYGNQVDCPEPDNLSHVIFYMLFYAERPAVARKATRLLAGGNPAEYFVSWNETRVATIRELGEALTECGVTRGFVAAQAIKHVLQRVWEIFDDTNIQLDTDDEADPNLQELLGSVSWPLIKDYIKCMLRPGRLPPQDPITDRVLQRLGIYDSETPKKDRNHLLKHLYQQNCLERYRLLLLLGKRVCGETPNCSRCPLNQKCKSAKVKQ